MHAILTQVRIPRDDKLLFWLPRRFLCSQSSFICLDGWGKKIPQITRRHLPQDITMCIPLLRFRIALVTFVSIRSIFSQPRITEGNSPIPVLFRSIYSIVRSQWPRGLRNRYVATRLLGLWVRNPPGHGWLSLVSVVCCQVEVSASGWSLAQRNPTECGVSECDHEISMKGSWPTRGCCARGGKRITPSVVALTTHTHHKPL